jgi:hypothetical protein
MCVQGVTFRWPACCSHNIVSWLVHDQNRPALELNGCSAPAREKMHLHPSLVTVLCGMCYVLCTVHRSLGLLRL